LITSFLILPQLATLFAFFSFPEPGAASSKVTRMVLPVWSNGWAGKQREQYAHAVEALSDPERTRLVLVARLQKSTLQEVARTHDELSAIGLKNQYLVINGVLPASEAERMHWPLQYGNGSKRRWQIFLPGYLICRQTTYTCSR
jgi:anion-transporting  ArsA/GET3 family ATPase